MHRNIARFCIKFCSWSCPQAYASRILVFRGSICKRKTNVTYCLVLPSEKFPVSFHYFYSASHINKSSLLILWTMLEDWNVMFKRVTTTKATERWCWWSWACNIHTTDTNYNNPDIQTSHNEATNSSHSTWKIIWSMVIL